MSHNNRAEKGENDRYNSGYIKRMFSGYPSGNPRAAQQVLTKNTKRNCHNLLCVCQSQDGTDLRKFSQRDFHFFEAQVQISAATRISPSPGNSYNVQTRDGACIGSLCHWLIDNCPKKTPGRGASLRAVHFTRFLNWLTTTHDMKLLSFEK
jgi:hypothetical protein